MASALEQAPLVVSDEDGSTLQEGLISRSKLYRPMVAGGFALTAATLTFVGLHAASSSQRVEADSSNLQAAFSADDPNWGCGLLGYLPGIEQDGTATPAVQELVAGLRASSTLNKVSYWNWNWAPQTTQKQEQHLTADFVFHPENWGAGVAPEKYVRQAGVANFLDSNGQNCRATMGDLFLGMNEPDIKGSCMGNMFGACKKPCSQPNVASGNCPAAHLDSDVQAFANADGECNCWQFSVATGVGFWPLAGCEGEQPLPTMFENAACTATVLDNWKKSAAIAVNKGYKYATTPLVAVSIDYTKKFIDAACVACKDISCGCPQYIGFHFYAYDCRPEHSSGLLAFQKKVDEVKAIMEDPQYSFVKGAIINEVGMLNCAPVDENPICVPDKGSFPATKYGGVCPNDGLAKYVTGLFEIVRNAKTSDGREIVKGFSWFNEKMAGGTYDLRVFDDAGNLNSIGKAYIDGCKAWAGDRR